MRSSPISLPLLWVLLRRRRQISHRQNTTTKRSFLLTLCRNNRPCSSAGTCPGPVRAKWPEKREKINPKHSRLLLPVEETLFLTHFCVSSSSETDSSRSSLFAVTSCALVLVKRAELRLFSLLFCSLLSLHHTTSSSNPSLTREILPTFLYSRNF